MLVSECGTCGYTIIKAGDTTEKRASDFAIECAELWREIYGARLGCYHMHEKLKRPTEGTYASLKRGVLAAAGASVAKARTGAGVPELGSEGVCELSPEEANRTLQKQEATTAGTSRNENWNVRFEKFAGDSAKKLAQHRLATRLAIPRFQAFAFLFFPWGSVVVF